MHDAQCFSAAADAGQHSLHTVMKSEDKLHAQLCGSQTMHGIVFKHSLFQQVRKQPEHGHRLPPECTERKQMKSPHPCSYFAHLATPTAMFAIQQQPYIHIYISSCHKTINKLKQSLEVHHRVFAACTQHSVWMTPATQRPHTRRCFLLLLTPHRRAEGGRVAHITNDALHTESVT